jgi:hypothetical protein
MRVLHGPVNVGNQPWSLSQAERALGIESEVVVTFNTWLNYPADRVLMSAPASKRWRDQARRIAFGLRAPFRYDVLHYYFAQSYFPERMRADFIDIRMARRLNRRVVVTLQGCDARLAGESFRQNAVTMCKPDGCSVYQTCLTSLDSKRRHFFESVLPLADRVFYLNPELGRYVPNGTFLPYANVGVEEIALEPIRVGRRPRILHAPSDDRIKGSQLIEAALAELSKRQDFEYVAVRNMPHAEAMKLYRGADLVIDQVLAGWYGGLGVELMAMGKPVACYIRDEDLAVVPPEMRAQLPVLRIHPGSLVQDLARILEQRPDWPAIGEASRAYALRWHNPRRIAAALIQIYNNPHAPLDLSDSSSCAA